jgi:predicted nucleic acid-binding protein
MNGVLIDSCVLLDLFTNDPKWRHWSENTLEQYSRTNTLYINAIVYTEVSIGFNKIEETESAIGQIGAKVLEIPREALFLAGKIFLQYRRNRGTAPTVLPDFFIGAHATISSFALMTRDTEKYTTYYPNLRLISPS